LRVSQADVYNIIRKCISQLSQYDLDCENSVCLWKKELDTKGYHVLLEKLPVAQDGSFVIPLVSPWQASVCLFACTLLWVYYGFNQVQPEGWTVEEGEGENGNVPEEEDNNDERGDEGEDGNVPEEDDEDDDEMLKEIDHGSVDNFEQSTSKKPQQGLLMRHLQLYDHLRSSVYSGEGIIGADGVDQLSTLLAAQNSHRQSTSTVNPWLL
jgi:hypothetical protein